MENDKLKKIMILSEKIDKVPFKTTYYFDIRKRQRLNHYDKQMLDYYQKILDLIIEIAKEENTKNIALIDKKYFTKEDNATSFLERYLSLLRFYSNLDTKIFDKAISVITQIQENLELSHDFETENQINLGNCYFHTGREAMAKKVMLDWIKKYPDEDDAYMCMQNWYVYVEPDVDKLEKVIDLAEANNHLLTSDFGYSKLVNHYNRIGDFEKKEKYQKIYDKWKKERKMESR